MRVVMDTDVLLSAISQLNAASTITSILLQ